MGDRLEKLRGEIGKVHPGHDRFIRTARATTPEATEADETTATS